MKTLKKTIFAALVLVQAWALLITPHLVSAGQTIPIKAHHSFLLKTGQPISRASVADPAVADITVLTPTQILIVAKTKKARSTSLIVWFDKDRVATYDLIIYNAIPERVIAAIKERINDLAPGVKIQVMGAGAVPGEEKILLTGSAASQEILSRVVKIAQSFDVEVYNLIRLKGAQQVQLKVVIAEISKTGLKQMGINFAGGGSSGSLGLLRGNTWEGTFPRDFTIHSPFASAFGILVSKSNWSGIIGLLKGQGLARTLATPTLVTMNGQRAEFQVGGEYPIPVQGDNGSTSIEYKNYGIMLAFTPYIIDPNTITLEVSPEVSAPDYSLGVSSGGATVPGLSSRKATTTLQLRPGQTFAMAGLLREEYRQTVDKVPFLGDIPFIGSVFTNKEVDYQESELVVIVTPTLVAAMEPDQVPPLPGSQVKTRTSDKNFFLVNQVENQDSPAPKGAFELKGKTGFIK